MLETQTPKKWVEPSFTEHKIQPPIERPVFMAPELFMSATPADLKYLESLQTKGENIAQVSVNFADLTVDSLPNLDVSLETMSEYFGRRNEIAKPPDLIRRMVWEDTMRSETWRLGEYNMVYRMVSVKDEQGEVMGAADYHIIYTPDGSIVAHLEHIYTKEEDSQGKKMRGRGAAQLLRAAPLHDAKNFITSHGLPDTTPITVVLEVEALQDEYEGDENKRDIPGRRRSYNKAGYLEIPQSEEFYSQPDYRDPKEIFVVDDDKEGKPEPVPLSLLVWRHNKETDTTMTPEELKTLTDALYAMYGRGIDPRVMDYCKNEQDGKIQEYLSQHSSIKLIPVTTEDRPESLPA